MLNSISIATVNYYIPVDFLGGSKPLPYTVKGNLWVVVRLLANLMIYATVGTTLAVVREFDFI